MIISGSNNYFIYLQLLFLCPSSIDHLECIWFQIKIEVSSKKEALQPACNEIFYLFLFSYFWFIWLSIFGNSFEVRLGVTDNLR